MEKVTASQVQDKEAHTEMHADADNDRATDRLALERQHTELERQLAALERHLSLTPDEQVEQRRLKKEKLRVKDQLYRLALPSARGV